MNTYTCKISVQAKNEINAAIKMTREISQGKILCQERKNISFQPYSIGFIIGIISVIIYLIIKNKI